MKYVYLDTDYGRDLTANISENFKYWEFVASEKAMQNMDKTWKDELILLIWLTPVVMSFVPEWQPYVIAGFASLALVPDWYMGILVGIIVVIYGMRGLLKMVLQMVGNRFNLGKHIDINNKDQR